MTPPQLTKQQRLTIALRENLKKRKQQSKQRQDPALIQPLEKADSSTQNQLKDQMGSKTPNR